MKYFIKKLNETHLTYLSKIMKQAFFQNPWNENWSEERCLERLKIINSISTSLGYVLVNEQEVILGCLIGYFAPLGEKDEFTILEFFVDQNYKEEHLGTTLMKLFLEKLNNEKVDLIHFYTSGNLDKFYSKFGFKKSKNEYLMFMENTPKS